MTSKIADGYRANVQKLEEIERLFKELREMTNKREDVLSRVIRYYNIIFKNISSKRKEVRVAESKQVYLVTKAGLTRKGEYQLNSINLTSIPKIEFLRELVMLSKPENKIAFKEVLSKQKYQIFDNFMRKSKLLQIKDKFEITINKQIKDYRLKYPILLIKVILIYGNLNLVIAETEEKPNNAVITNNIQFPLYSTTSLENISFLEQVYPETKKLLKMSKNNKVKEISNLNKFIEYLRTKFENQLVLEELNSKH